MILHDSDHRDGTDGQRNQLEFLLAKIGIPPDAFVFLDGVGQVASTLLWAPAIRTLS